MGRLESFLDAHKNALREAKERLERTETGYLRLLGRMGSRAAATVRQQRAHAVQRLERLEVSFVAEDARPSCWSDARARCV